MDLSIIIVSWNTKELLRSCLQSIILSTKGISYDIFVVDNASTDGTVEMCRENFPEVKLIANKDNLGFATANNQALTQAQGDVLLLLNPDTEVSQNALSDMLSFVHRQSNPVLAACQLRNPDGSRQLSVRRDPSVVASVMMLLKLHNFFPRMRWLREYFCLDFDYDKEQRVEQVMGACMMFPRSLYECIGGMDDAYPLLFEDVDYCKRVREAGFEVWYTPSTCIMHVKGQSFARAFTPTTQRNFNIGLLRYFYKQRSVWGVLVVAVLFFPSIALSLVSGMAPRSWKRNEL